MTTKLDIDIMIVEAQAKVQEVLKELAEEKEETSGEAGEGQTYE